MFKMTHELQQAVKKARARALAYYGETEKDAKREELAGTLDANDILMGIDYLAEELKK